jgi:membrane-anchored glycerophosphoryl diester phosphodiesterase (GDPDase)
MFTTDFNTFSVFSMIPFFLLGFLLPVIILVVTYYFIIRFAFIQQIIIIEDQSALKAISLSGQRTSGHKWKILAVLYILSMVQGFVTYFAILVLFIPLMIVFIFTRNLIITLIITFVVIFTVMTVILTFFSPLPLIANTIIYSEALQEGITSETLEVMRKASRSVREIN